MGLTPESIKLLHPSINQEWMTGEKDIPALPYHGNNPFLSSTMDRLQNCAIAFLFPPWNRIVCVLQLHIVLCAVHGTGNSMRKLYQTTLITCDWVFLSTFRGKPGFTCLNFNLTMTFISRKLVFSLIKISDTFLERRMGCSLSNL